MEAPSELPHQVERFTRLDYLQSEASNMESMYRNMGCVITKTQIWDRESLPYGGTRNPAILLFQEMPEKRPDESYREYVRKRPEVTYAAFSQNPIAQIHEYKKFYSFQYVTAIFFDLDATMEGLGLAGRRQTLMRLKQMAECATMPILNDGPFGMALKNTVPQTAMEIVQSFAKIEKDTV